MESTKIDLVVPKYGIRQSFVADHAERLLRLKDNGGWQLPEDSEYDFNDGTISRRCKKESGRGGKRRSD